MSVYTVYIDLSLEVVAWSGIAEGSVNIAWDSLLSETKRLTSNWTLKLTYMRGEQTTAAGEHKEQNPSKVWAFKFNKQSKVLLPLVKAHKGV